MKRNDVKTGFSNSLSILVLVISLSLLSYPDSQAPIKVTFISNEGYLIEAGHSKVLIDALHDLVPEYVQERLRKAAPPFDSIDLILNTHDHHDHFQPELTAALLASDPNVNFVGNKRAAMRITSYYEGKDDIWSRLKVYQPEEGDKLDLNYSDIELKIFYLHHGRNRPDMNLAYLVKIGEKTLLHMGDSLASLEDLRLYALPQENIDVAFIPYWYFSNETLQKAIREGIGAKVLVPMHFDLMDGGPGRKTVLQKRIAAEFPDAVIFTQELESRIFSP
jgi:L-ascorbate metabolism protein UlaG (beta-lactamase superfamily)